MENLINNYGWWLLALALFGDIQFCGQRSQAALCFRQFSCPLGHALFQLVF